MSSVVYINQDEFLLKIRTADDPDSNQNAILDTFLISASRAVDIITRQDAGAFAVATDQATAVRYFAGGDGEVWIDPCLAITTLQTSDDDWDSSDTWTADTDYWKSSGIQIDTLPYRRLIENENGSYTFPDKERGVKVTGRWGYAYASSGQSSLPAVREATFMIARYLWNLPEDNERPLVTSDGVYLPGKLNEMVKLLLAPYTRL